MRHPVALMTLGISFVHSRIREINMHHLTDGYEQMEHEGFQLVQLHFKTQKAVHLCAPFMGCVRKPLIHPGSPDATHALDTAWRVADLVEDGEVARLHARQDLLPQRLVLPRDAERQHVRVGEVTRPVRVHVHPAARTHMHWGIPETLDSTDPKHHIRETETERERERRERETRREATCTCPVRTHTGVSGVSETLLTQTTTSAHTQGSMLDAWMFTQNRIDPQTPK